MKYTELKKEIKAASKQAKKDGIAAFFTYTEKWDQRAHEFLTSNFTDSRPTDDQLAKAENEGLLTRDWDTYFVA